ncbi:uncharacterized protein [Paralichthys olivaceus]|uniref:uncharacterized protein n=1 Tax=Paralichthys olivaceus TaxID=8255 RepID=UPI00097CE8F3|nr:PREDICTED: uncharacterized protein LOC109625528 [Paralichthys olivaceus]
MGSDYQLLSTAGSCRSLSIETPECFICRDVELQASDPLRNFCDCKNLLAHHACLSTWIQRGYGNEDRLRCIICKAKYQLQWSSPWRSVSFRWQTWLVLITAFVLLGLVPYVVHCMMTVFTSPPPPSTFKVAAASFGLLTEILLIKCLSSYLSSRYRQAEQSSFTVRARGSEEDRASLGLRDQSEATSAAAGHASSTAAPSQVDARKVDVLESGCLSLF